MTSQLDEPKISLFLLNEWRDFTYAESEGADSPHTGKLIRSIQVSFSTPSALSSSLNEELDKGRSDSGAILEKDSERMWQVESYSRSTGGQYGDNQVRYLLNLDEVEKLAATAVELPGLILSPVEYSEEIGGDSLVVTLVADVNDEQNDILETLVATSKSISDNSTYFPVRRVGVSESEILMRFGLCLWEERTAGRRHLLNLVAKEGDDPEDRLGPLLRNQPFNARLAEAALSTAAQFNALLTELERSGSLTNEAIRRVRSSGGRFLPVDSRFFDRVEDVHDFL